MKYFLMILLFFCFSLTGCGSNNLIDNYNEDNYYTSSKISTTNSVTNISTNNTIINDIKSTTNTENELSSFTTKIYTPNDEARQTNIRITCSKLNGTIVNARSNFFFL